MCECNLNSRNFKFDSESQRSALNVLRKAGYTGPKKVCNSGACGACAIEVDGKIVNSCITPSHKLVGKEVKTIESYTAKKSNLHPVQKAFIDNDALQCGFCTPGFVMEAINFYDSWTSINKGKTPRRDEVAQALSGHLCRCGAYPNIYTAVQRACAGEYDDSDYKSHRYDALEKVTGEAKYTFDVQFDNELMGYVFRSPYPHAYIRSINLGEIENLEGVYAVVDLLPPDKVVRYVGKEMFAVAIEGYSTIQKIKEVMDVVYELRDFVVSDLAAQNEDSPLVYKLRERKHVHDASEGFMIPGRWKGNVREALTFSSTKKKIAKQIIETAEAENSKYLVKRRYSTSSQIHTPLEPHVCVANYKESGELDVYLSTQAVYDTAERLASKLDLPVSSVNVHAKYIGGAFGCKLSLTEEAVAAAKLSLRCKRPVRVEFSRADEIAHGGIRAGSDIDVALVADDDNKLKAISVDCYSYAGVGAGYTSTFFIKNAYGKTPKALADYEVMTNKAPGRPFRAPGACRITFALESAVDEMASKLNADPIDLRLSWEMHENKKILLEEAKKTDLWKSRKNIQNKGRYTKGVGVATATWPYFYEAYGSVELIATRKGLVVKSAAQDIGTGSKTVIRDAVLENFDMPEKLVEVDLGDSNYPRNVSSGGSMTTPSTYYAVVKACKELKKQISKDYGEIEDWEEFFKKLDNDISVTESRGEDITIVNKLLNAYLGKDTSSNVVVSEVIVDNYLNTFRVSRIWSGVAAGKIVVPKLAENQVYGGVIQGLGYALFEEKLVDEQFGIPLTYNLENYKIPGIADSPEIDVYFYEGGFEHVKGGAIGLAEVVTIPVSGSIANAIFNATGKPVTKLPITFESF